MNEPDRNVRLFVPPSARRFSPRRVVPGPGMRHVAVEYDLVAALRPALIVDLGAGDCASFFAYCQSMVEHDVDGSCYAIDLWQDDGAAFDEVSGHGRGHYAGVSYFVRMPPADAIRHFDDETIDVLRIDATRSDGVVGDDLDAWFRKVRPGGVVVWHGAASNPDGWSWLAARCSAVTFSEGRGGLGLARKDGPPPTEELVRLLFHDGEGADVERFYKHVHEHLEFARLLAVALKAT